MAKPTFSGKITPFDANKDYIVNMNWTGNMVYSNRIIIYDSDTLDVVFDDIIQSFSLTHTIPAYTLTNGKLWVMQCQVYDSEGVASTLSDKISFYTFETPIFKFKTIEENNNINNASYVATVEYEQSNYEPLYSYQFSIYDTQKNLLTKSDILYDIDNISYVYRGLENSQTYYLRCQGTTLNGMSVDTNYVEVYVYYENPYVYSKLYVENVAKGGYIKYNTNIVVVDYNGDDTFEFEDGKIDLTSKELCYDNGFEIKDNFTLSLKGTNLFSANQLLEMSNDHYSLLISSHMYNDNKLKFRLLAPNALGAYLLYSPLLSFTDSDMVSIWIRRVNDAYQMDVYINGTKQ